MMLTSSERADDQTRSLISSLFPASLVTAFAIVLFIALFPYDAATAADIKAIETSNLNVITIDGEISSGDAIEFIALVSVDPTSRYWIYLNSIGGEVREAMTIAAYIRFSGYGTFAGPECASSCFLIFAAGTQRQAVSGAKLGIHGVRDAITNSEIGQATIDIIRELKAWGVPDGVLGRMAITPPSDIYVLTQSELSSLASLKDFDLKQGAQSMFEFERAVKEAEQKNRPKNKDPAEKSALEIKAEAFVREFITRRGIPEEHIIDISKYYSSHISYRGSNDFWTGFGSMRKNALKWEAEFSKGYAGQRVEILNIHEMCLEDLKICSITIMLKSHRDNNDIISIEDYEANFSDKIPKIQSYKESSISTNNILITPLKN